MNQRIHGPKRYLWRHDVGVTVHGGIKATRDAERIIADLGWEIFHTTCTGSPIARMWQLIIHIARLARIPRNSIFFVQLPQYGFASKVIIQILIRFFNTVSLLHDIDGLRNVFKRSRVHRGTSEIAAHSKYIISTGRLADYLPRLKKGTKLVRMEVWDYLLQPSFREVECRLDGRMIFVGNLTPSKSPGIFRPESNRPPLVLIGTSYDPLTKVFKDDEYLGPCNADNPDIDIAVSWGLVWDGGMDDHNAFTGNEYEKICQPHKLSFYLACGIPVIVWDASFASKFVLSHHCGITVSSLGAITSAIARINQLEYDIMRSNARFIGAALRQGLFLKTALKRLHL